MWKRRQNETTAARTIQTQIKNQFKLATLRQTGGERRVVMLKHKHSGDRLVLLVSLVFATLLSVAHLTVSVQVVSSPGGLDKDKVAPSLEPHKVIAAADGHHQHEDIAQPTRVAQGTARVVDSGHAGTKPPRGYCVRISKAIKPESRCYKHLIQTHAGGNSNVKQQPARSSSPDPLGHKTTTVSDSANSTAPVLNIGAKERGGGDHGRHHEELVYVRSETLGDKITNLSTQAVNEHLINGLLERMMGGNDGRPRAASGAVDYDDDEQIRMQMILSSSPADCRLAIEKFLCRLVYPSCHFRSIDVVALVRPPCREDCLLLREHICAGLNWTQFSQTLQRAFKATLMSTINALDLLVDGDPSASPSLLFGNPPPQSASSLSAPTNLPMNDKDSIANKRNTTERDRQRRGANFAGGSSSPIASWSALNRNLSSSVHFYWPHERSIERCESLPILWPSSDLTAHAGGGEFGRRGTNTSPTKNIEKKTQLEMKQFRRWLRDHKTRNYWPICSDARLTDLNELHHEHLAIG